MSLIFLKQNAAPSHETPGVIAASVSDVSPLACYFLNRVPFEIMSMTYDGIFGKEEGTGFVCTRAARVPQIDPQIQPETPFPRSISHHLANLTDELPRGASHSVRT